MSGKVSNTLKVLMQIRDRQDSLEASVASLEASVASLEQTVTTEMRAVAAVLHDVRDILRDRLDTRDAVVDHERRISALERRAG